MFKATVTEMVQNATTRFADVQAAVLTDRIENEREREKKKGLSAIKCHLVYFLFIFFKSHVS
jgi:predicted MarR family transcription regulator